jgi:methylated-DNA-protein-cysteine methyltransferase related protein
VSEIYARIYAVVRRIPPGKVSTYGEVARMAGLPGYARQVGYALHALGEGEDVPWQRVVNIRGEVSLPTDAGLDSLQRQMLEAEGVLFNAQGRLDLKQFRWESRRR